MSTTKSRLYMRVARWRWPEDIVVTIRHSSLLRWISSWNTRRPQYPLLSEPPGQSQAQICRGLPGGPRRDLSNMWVGIAHCRMSWIQAAPRHGVTESNRNAHEYAASVSITARKRPLRHESLGTEHHSDRSVLRFRYDLAFGNGPTSGKIEKGGGRRCLAHHLDVSNGPRRWSNNVRRTLTAHLDVSVHFYFAL